VVNINTFEIFVNQVLQNLGEWLSFPMLAITALGYEEFFVLLLPTLYWCVDQGIGLRVGIILMTANTFNTFFKFLFHSPRPYWISDDVIAYSHETSFGLPSGHAQIAASVWGWLAVEVKKRWFTLVAVGLIFLIGFSRLYLGVHFLSDVLLGWFLGALLVFLFMRWQNTFSEWLGRQDGWVKVVIVCLSTALIILIMLIPIWIVGPWVMPQDWAARAGEVAPYDKNDIYTLAGTWFGMVLGYVILTEKKGHFKAKEGGWRRLIRLLIGLVGLLVLYFGLGQIFPDSGDFVSYALRFLRYMLIGLWVSWLGPLLFERMGILRFEGQNEPGED